MSRPLIHIGLHKTGSTLLQKHLFSLAEAGFCMPEGERRLLLETFVLRGPLEGAESLRTARLRQQALDAVEIGKTLVLSHERLSGYPASGGFDRALIAQRLAEAFPHARVLIVIREQRAMILSMYLQYISDGGNLSLCRFLNPAEPSILRRPGFRFDYFDYDQLYNCYADVFGQENILLLPYERLLTDLHGSFKCISDFSRDTSDPLPDKLEIPARRVNRARPVAAQYLRRALNSVVRNQLADFGVATIPTSYVEHSMSRLGPIFEILRPIDRPLRRHLQRQIDAACTGKYLQSNSRISLSLGLELEKYNYTCDSV
jgi:hypothetical protein